MALEGAVVMSLVSRSRATSSVVDRRNKAEDIRDPGEGPGEVHAKNWTVVTPSYCGYDLSRFFA